VNPALAAAQSSAPISLVARSGDCTLQFDPIGKEKFDRRSCDIAKSLLAKAGVNYANVEARAGQPTELRIGRTAIAVPVPQAIPAAQRASAIAQFQERATAAVKAAGYPDKADPAQVDRVRTILILTILVLYVTMVYGPIAALLVELFPARIRYTSMSLPYHIGNGWFGGFLPTIAFAIVAASGSIYAGLWYPIIVAGVTVVVGLLLLPETRHRPIDDASTGSSNGGAGSSPL
jgi:hypothetical protein